MCARWMVMGAAVAVLAVSLGGCNGEPGMAASFDYALSARFKVPDLQPLEEQGEYEVYADGPLHRDNWLVQFDACPPTGSPIKYSWRVDGMAIGEFIRCDEFEYEFPGEGTYSVSLVVEDAAGEEVEQTSDVVVRDLLIFGVGDSYASGEGNPDVNASDDDGVQWQSQRCHRSEYSGQVRAAQMVAICASRSGTKYLPSSMKCAESSSVQLIRVMWVRSRRAQVLAGERPLDQLDGFLEAVEGDEGAHARALALAQQDLVERPEPGAQVW